MEASWFHVCGCGEPSVVSLDFFRVFGVRFACRRSSALAEYLARVEDVGFGGFWRVRFLLGSIGCVSFFFLLVLCLGLFRFRCSPLSLVA